VTKLTRLMAGIIIAGVVVQGALAGGFLAGRPALRDLHERVGHGLLAVAVMLLVLGLLARLRRPPSTAQLPTRAALVLALTVTVFAGMQASRGSGDLLMAHIPVAFAVLALAARLLTRGDERSLHRDGGHGARRPMKRWRQALRANR
jgi:hypothetical protein